jgi:hypothetical protein
MIRKVTSVALMVGLLTATPASQYAFANGAAFFSDPAAVAEIGTLYFGIVKDEKGTPVVGATVSVHIKGQNIDYVYQTSTLGRYRSIDLPKDVDPKLVEVDVEKKGFQTVSRVNRTGTTKPGLPVEINFTVAPSA